VTCHNCRIETVKAGLNKYRVQRWKCQQCGKRFTEPRQMPFGADARLPIEKVEMILHCLVEGNSVRSTARLCDVEPRTVLNILVLAAEKCEKVMGRLIVNVPVKDVECDEIWGFVQKKEGHKGPGEAHNETIGDAYCFVAVERHSKLVLNFALGRRNEATTNIFIEGLRLATSSQHFQITADGFPAYPNAIDSTLSDRCDFAMLIKVYRASQDGEARYSPAEVQSVEVVPVMGQPDPERICTSIVERQNLSVRMGTRRFTRLTNAFSKKFENHWAAVALWFTNAPVATAEDKCTICHVPPGNPANAHTLVIGCSAVDAHMRNHPGDCMGPCPCQPTPSQNR